MDACFGLSRKKAQGQSLDEPKHKTLYFADQDDVDNFVDGYGESSEEVEQVQCNLCIYVLFLYPISVAKISEMIHNIVPIMTW